MPIKGKDLFKEKNLIPRKSHKRKWQAVQPQQLQQEFLQAIEGYALSFQYQTFLSSPKMKKLVLGFVFVKFLVEDITRE
jgi:hypothetical protein